MNENIQRILTNKPFLSYIVYGGNDYIGVIQNVDDTVTTMYDYGALKSEEQKLLFLQLADDYWMSSNRKIPINVFLRLEWAVFRPTLKIFNSKDVDIKFGPYISLREMALCKSKKRSITLVRKVT